MGAGTETVPPEAVQSSDLTWCSQKPVSSLPRVDTLVFSRLVVPGISTYRCRDASLPIMFMREQNC